MKDIAVVSVVLLAMFASLVWWMCDASMATCDKIRTVETNERLIDRQTVDTQLSQAGIERRDFDRITSQLKEQHR